MKKRLVILLLTLFVIAVILFRFYDRLPVIECATRFHSAWGSVDCGHVTTRVGKGADAAISCAQFAFRSGRPFTVIFTGSGIDARISNALVVDSKGNGIELFYGTGLVSPGGLVKHRCGTPMRLELEEDSPYGFPRLHCAPSPPRKINRDFLLW
ncbi:MAG TPA: hypothetical protein VD837_10310 [Terriglobales bacterium]|nr:hypothetical protein [Terriglobales bacterium]